MGAIFGLYSTRDGLVRYVGQTEYNARKSLDLIITRALDREPSALLDWVRHEWREQHEVRAHVLQDDVIPADLEMFEGYWTGQFSGLLNDGQKADPQRPTSEVGHRINAVIRAELQGETPG